MAEQPRINVAKEFAIAVKKAGGEVLDEVLTQPDFQNADYVFRADQVIAELKCLDEDKASDPKFCKKLAVTYHELMRAGRAPIVFGHGRVSTQQIANIDEQAAFEFMNVFKDRMQVLVKKANQQIKETAVRIGQPDAKGLLLLVNDGDMAFEFEIVLHVLGRLLNNHFRSIHEVVFFTVNETVQIPGHHPAARIWSELPIDGRPMIPESFLLRLREAWLNHLATIMREPVGAISIDGSREPNISKVKLTNGKQITLHL